jgi:MFS family permease
MVLVAFIIMLLSWGLYVVFGVFFDPLLQEFGWTRTMISGAYSLSSILSGLIGIVMGGLTDRFGPRAVVTFCGFCLGLGYLLMSQVHALWQFYLYYGVVIGTGMSGVWIPLVSPIARWFSDRRSLMTGIVISGLTVGQLIAPPLISRLIAAYDWRMSYAILGGAVLVVIVVLAQFLRRDPGQPVRLTGNENERNKPDFKIDAGDFSLREAVRTQQFWLVAVIFFCVGWDAIAVTVHIVPHAIDLGISSVTAANILAVNGGTGIIGNFVLGGIIGDRIGNRKAFIIGIAAMAASLFWLVPATQVWMLYLFAVTFGVALGGTGTSESPLIARLFGLRSHGFIYGVAALSWTAGSAVGPVVTGYMFDMNGNYQAAFLVSGVIGILGLVLIIALRPTKRRGMEL